MSFDAPPMKRQRIAIVGGGISGMSALISCRLSMTLRSMKLPRALVAMPEPNLRVSRAISPLIQGLSFSTM